jgi:hypothetical protein
MVRHPPRAFPWEIEPPVGTPQGTGKPRRRARGRRVRPRICLRKGCGRKYQPRCRHQRFCQDPDCQREVRRWQAARRQGQRRQKAGVKSRHAQAEKARRQRAKSASEPVGNPEIAPARGHAAATFFLTAGMRPARLLRAPRKLAPQSGTLLRPRLSAGRSQCPGS